MEAAITAYLATVVPFLTVDAIWLIFVAGPMFQARIGHLMAPQVNLPAAGAFYLFYVVGVVYFAVWPALDAGEGSLALVNGLLLGFVAYGTYDVTNYATLRGYPFFLVMLDVVWGGLLTGMSALAGFHLTRLFGVA